MDNNNIINIRGTSRRPGDDRRYRRMKLEPFARQLITSGDLNPVAIMLVKASLPEDQLFRWLVSYWCLDHCGAASYLSDYQGVEFLRMLWRAAADSMAAPIGRRWPRGPRLPAAQLSP